SAVKTFGQISTFRFFKGIFPAAAVAFSTSSSAGTLPVTMKNTQENLGDYKETSSLILPLGATINMDGKDIYNVLAIVFIAQYFVTKVTDPQVLMVAFIGTFTSIGIGGVPGAGKIMLTLKLEAVTLPLEQIAMITIMDPNLDTMRTPVNIVEIAKV